MIDRIKAIRKEGDTIGGTVTCVLKNVPLGLGEPVFDKLHAELGKAMLSINAVKGFEFGSGLGFFLSACQRINLYKHVGYDINPYEREFAISKGIDPNRYLLAKWVTKYQLGRYELKTHGSYDAIYSTEVFEHMTDEQISFVMPILYKACNKYFYFTSTPHASADPAWDIEWGHINLKQKDEWVAMFARHGFDLLREATEVTPWGLLFVKREKK